MSRSHIGRDGDRGAGPNRPYVMTARGPIASEELGLTLPHEHIIAKPLDVGTDDPDLLLDDTDAALAELGSLYQAGGRAVVDMTPVDYGRDAAAIAWIATRTPVHIIVTTGHHKHLHAAPYLAGRALDEIVAANIRELTEGIDGTGIKAGVIKAGTSLDTITPVEERVLRAAARAHLATGAPISTHTDRGTMALQQLEIFREEGVDASRVIVGHLDFQLDETYLRAVLDTGAYASFDQVSKTKYAPDEERAAMVKRLVDLGYRDQLLLSGDLARRSYWLAYNGGPGWVYLLKQFTARLFDVGLDEGVVRQLFVVNPARALTIRA